MPFVIQSDSTPKPVATFTKMVAGDITVSGATYGEISSGLRLSIAANPGDVLEYGLNAFSNPSGGSNGQFDAATLNGSNAIVNYFGCDGGATDSIGGWLTVASTYGWLQGAAFYTVVAGDIFNGRVTVTLIGRMAGAGTTTIEADATNPAFAYLKNHRQ